MQTRSLAAWAFEVGPRFAFGNWAVSTGLAMQFPNASAEGDDPDGDGFTNGDEWFAATDPTQRASRLELELTPRPADLAASDQTPVEADQHAVSGRERACHAAMVDGAGNLYIGGDFTVIGDNVSQISCNSSIEQ